MCEELGSRAQKTNVVQTKIKIVIPVSVVKNKYKIDYFFREIGKGTRYESKY